MAVFHFACDSPLVWQVISAEDGWTSEDEALFATLLPGLRSRPLLLAINKTDQAPLGTACVPAHVAAFFRGVADTSAVLGEGIAALEEALASTLGVGQVEAAGGFWAANQRQAEALEQAACALQRLEAAVGAGLPIDCWCIELREAAMALGEVTGTDISEGVLDTIFSRFCIGACPRGGDLRPQLRPLLQASERYVAQ